MRCTKCNSELITTGTGRALAKNPIVNSYTCPNQSCENFQQVGRLINEKFILEKERSERKE